MSNVNNFHHVIFTPPPPSNFILFDFLARSVTVRGRQSSILGCLCWSLSLKNNQIESLSKQAGLLEGASGSPLLYITESIVHEATQLNIAVVGFTQSISGKVEKDQDGQDDIITVSFATMENMHHMFVMP